MSEDKRTEALRGAYLDFMRSFLSPGEIAQLEDENSESLEDSTVKIEPIFKVAVAVIDVAVPIIVAAVLKAINEQKGKTDA